jgi:hypothetical protein
LASLQTIGIYNYRKNLFVAGGWLLVVGCWWLVVGGWWLVVGSHEPLTINH